MTRARTFTPGFLTALALAAGCGSGAADLAQPVMTGCASAPTAPVALIDDWNGTPSAAGAVIKTALAGYDDPRASPAAP